MRTGTVTCDHCKTGPVADDYAAQNGWVAFRIEPLAGPTYQYRRDLCGDCAGVVLEFIG